MEVKSADIVALVCLTTVALAHSGSEDANNNKKESNLFQVCTRKHILASGHCLQRPPLPPPSRVFVNKSNNLDDSSSRKVKREEKNEVDPRTLFISLPDDIEVESDYFGCGHKKVRPTKREVCAGLRWARELNERCTYK